MKEMIEKILANEATAEELESFARAARADAALRSVLAEHAVMEGLLGVALESIEARHAMHSKTLAAIDATDETLFVAKVLRRVDRGRDVRRLLALAAVLMFCITGWWLVSTHRQGHVKIVRVESLPQADQGWESGARLKRGQRLRFSSGLMELQVGKKGRMILEGPADIEFPEEGRAVVHRGQVVMRVTPEGHGYTIVTPQGNLVDLGTEFGVSVAPSGESKIHVLDGEVEAEPKGGKKVLLRKSEALSLSKGGSKIPAEEGDFYTSLPPVSKIPENFIHWPFDEIDNDISPSVGRGFDSALSKELKLRSTNGGEKPRKIEGVFGGALAFNGSGAYAESDFRGIGGGQSRTVCFWVKVPKDFSNNEGFAMVSWGSFSGTRAGEVWQIAVNPGKGDGSAGRLRVGTHEGRIIGSRDLRDGEWHHVAVVLYGGSQPNIGTHVIVYIDGKLEEISARTLTRIQTNVETTSHGVWLGRNITYYRQSGNPQGGFFRGGIDEVYIFDAALSQKEIERLRIHNQ